MTIKILGNGTQTQKDKVQKALQLAGIDTEIIRKIEVYNTNNIANLAKVSGFDISTGETVEGFAVLPSQELGKFGPGNRIVLAGRCKDLTFVTLHEVGHLVNGRIVDFTESEIEASKYATAKLGRVF